MDSSLAEQDFTSKFDWALWRRVTRFLRPHRRLLLQFAGAMGGIGLFEGAYNSLLKYIVDDVTTHGAKAAFGLYVSIYAGLLLLNSLGVWFFVRTGGRLASRLSHDVRRAGFERLQTLDFAYFDQRPTGWLISRMTSDCDRLADTITWGAINLVWGSCFMGGIAVIMLLLNWRLAFIVLSVIPFMAVVAMFFQRKLLRSSREMRKLNSRLTSSYNEMLMGVATTKTLVREEANLREFSALSRNMYVVSVRNAVQASLLWPSLIIMGSIGSSLALKYGGEWALRGALSIGSLIAFFAFSRDFFIPIVEMSGHFTNLQMAQAAAERVMSLIETEPSIKDSAAVLERIARHAASPQAGAPELAIDGGARRFSQIEFRDVDFAYNAGRRVLSGFNLTVRAGERIALVGPTGGGKSTIVSLLCRFYEPTAGHVLFDGVDYRERSLQWLQSNLGIVLQTPHLFSGSIRDNIRYGRLDATDGEIEEAARLVRADDFIRNMPQGYDTEAGQGGVNLSTGQKQLISFARAVIANPQIFVMDEATSSVDTPTEHLIQAGLERVMSGRTSFIVAHRLSTIRNADRILVIQAGRIVEIGNHHELIQRRGAYYALYTDQFTAQRGAALLTSKDGDEDGDEDGGAQTAAAPAPAN